MTLVYTFEQMNEAIERVEIAKQNHPRGWKFLTTLGLAPADNYVAYAFTNARLHAERLGLEEDRIVVYSAGWLNGLAIGVSLGEQRE